MKDWIIRLERLSDLLSEAGVDWNPWIWNLVIRVRRGARLPPELVAEMKSSLDMLRAIVARTTTVEDLREFLRRCETNARETNVESHSDLAERWRELAERTSRTGRVYLEEADELTMEALGERAFRIDEVEAGEAWPARGPSLPGMSLREPEREYLVKPKKPEPRAASPLRSLSALVRAWDRGDLEPKGRRNEG